MDVSEVLGFLTEESKPATGTLTLTLAAAK